MFRKEAQDEKRRNVRIEDGKRLVLFMEMRRRIIPRLRKTVYVYRVLPQANRWKKEPL